MPRKFAAVDWGQPMRLGGVLGLSLLLGPGSVAGVSMLLARAGFSPVLPLVQPGTHAMLQLAGFFMVVIWGFLTHGLVGMLGARSADMAHIRAPMIGLCASLWLGFGCEVTALPWSVVKLCGLLQLAMVVWGTAVVARAVKRARHSWRVLPFGFLVAGLMLFPLVMLMSLLGRWGLLVLVRANDVMLVAVVLPIILSMCFRMFSPMLGLYPPRPMLFAYGVVVWILMCAVQLVGATQPLLTSVAGALGVAATGLMCGSFRIFERRPVSQRRARDQSALDVHMTLGCAWLGLGFVLQCVSVWDVLPGSSYLWGDVARHWLAVGGALTLVMGITQRVFPNFLAGRPAHLPWMWLNLVLVTTGVLLRPSEAFLPEDGARFLVHLSAWLTYGGITGYGFHLLRSMVLRAKPGELQVVPVMQIRRAAPAPAVGEHAGKEHAEPG